MEKIYIEEFMDNLDMFQSRSEKIDEFGWWGLERISADAGSQFTSTDSKKIMPNSRSSFEIGISGTSDNERTGRSDM